MSNHSARDNNEFINPSLEELGDFYDVPAFVDLFCEQEKSIDVVHIQGLTMPEMADGEFDCVIKFEYHDEFVATLKDRTARGPAFSLIVNDAQTGHTYMKITHIMTDEMVDAFDVIVSSTDETFSDFVNALGGVHEAIKGLLSAEPQEEADLDFSSPFAKPPTIN
jgi:hypothetical protein